MQWRGYTVQCPLVLGASVSEAEVLGASVWLWMHSQKHRDTPLSALPAVLLPAIKAQQYVLVSRNDQPVFFMSWAWFDEDAEHRYLTQHDLLRQEADWCSGDRMWVMDFVAPFGDTPAMSELVMTELFAHHCFCSLWHRGEERGLRIKRFYGRSVPRKERAAWRDRYTPAASVKVC